MKSRLTLVIAFVLLFIFAGVLSMFGWQGVEALDATSTNFFIRQHIVPIGRTAHTGSNVSESQGTSTTFRLFGAGGETALGTSTSDSFNLLGGYIRSLYHGPAPLYTQIHYHWRNDDGSETTATSKTSGTADTDISSVAKSTTIRLRVGISNEGGTKAGYATQQFRLEYGLKSTTCAAIASWTDVAAASGDWDPADSTNLTEGANTTNIAVSSGGVADENHTFVTANGGVRDTSSQTSAINVTSEEFIDLEYSIQALSGATDGGSYCFRVTDAGSTTYYDYVVYPQATLAAGGGYLYFSLDGSTEAFGAITPATLAATSSILTARTDNSTGFNVTIQRSDPTGTMSSGSIYIPDKTAWVPGVDTSTAGNATASTTEPQTLQFRVRSAGTDAPNYASAWWGVSDTTAAALFAGIPSTARLIVNRSSSALSTTTAQVLYNVTVPITQQSGSYSGSIIYTATANP